MTVEEEHVYHVGYLNLLAHNVGCVDIIKPGGKKIGVAGSSERIRLIHKSSAADAENMFLDILQSEGVNNFNTTTNNAGQIIHYAHLPNGGTVRYRPVSTSGPPTIDIERPSLSDWAYSEVSSTGHTVG